MFHNKFNDTTNVKDDYKHTKKNEPPDYFHSSDDAYHSIDDIDNSYLQTANNKENQYFSNNYNDDKIFNSQNSNKQSKGKSISQFHNYCNNNYQQQYQQKQHRPVIHSSHEPEDDIEYNPPYYYNRNKHNDFRRNKRHNRSPSPTYHPSHPYRNRKSTSWKSSRKASVEETSKRAQHNVLERQRRSNLKDLFVSLKNHIPSMSNPHSSSKFSKVHFSFC